MKKLLIVSLLVVVLMLLAVSAASANGGPHGDYTATTDACAGCHRAHTATGDNLLVASDTYTLCITCHGSGAQGANTNVDDGYYLSSRDDSTGDGNHGATNTPDNAALLGGGFVNYKGNLVTSTHDPKGILTGAWGEGGVGRGEQGEVDALDCASCHDPHGSTNYRIIKTTINGIGVNIAQVDDVPATAKDYDTNQWNQDLNNICAACHVAYHADENLNHEVAGNNSAYNDPPSYTDWNSDNVTVPLTEAGELVCETCHLPHGTAAAMTGYADGAGPAGDSALLRLDNRGVCMACHGDNATYGVKK